MSSKRVAGLRSASWILDCAMSKLLRCVSKSPLAGFGTKSPFAVSVAIFSLTDFWATLSIFCNRPLRLSLANCKSWAVSNWEGCIFGWFLTASVGFGASLSKSGLFASALDAFTLSLISSTFCCITPRAVFITRLPADCKTSFPVNPPAKPAPPPLSSCFSFRSSSASWASSFAVCILTAPLRSATSCLWVNPKLSAVPAFCW